MYSSDTRHIHDRNLVFHTRYLSFLPFDRLFRLHRDSNVPRDYRATKLTARIRERGERGRGGKRKISNDTARRACPVVRYFRRISGRLVRIHTIFIFCTFVRSVDRSSWFTAVAALVTIKIARFTPPISLTLTNQMLPGVMRPDASTYRYIYLSRRISISIRR